MSRACDSPPPAQQSFLVRRRTALPLVVLLLALPLILFTSHPWPEIGILDYSLNTLGYLLIFGGIIGRLWATLYIGGRKAETVMRTGPYSIVRHPLYVSNLLLGIGFGLLTENFILLGAIVVFFVIQYTATIRFEERLMLERFGEAYRSYQRDVPRFLPNFTRYTDEPPVSIHMPALRKELLTSLCFIVLIPVIQLVVLLQELGVVRHIIIP
ncbi:MAG: Isoprenylcysteine carboxyl methyltransferase (ICMT) family protein [bacterium ADurb.Bin429]|nr:MAG: Isoprenylcysteine carboxyl methyltransferase (ICMT) family protein [bacterium ADurb.Bin429]